MRGGGLAWLSRRAIIAIYPAKVGRMPYPETGHGGFSQDRRGITKPLRISRKRSTTMHLCIVCNTHPAQAEDAAFCGDTCAEAWQANARNALARIQRLIEAEARAEKALGAEMGALAIEAHAEASRTGRWN